MSHIFVSYKHDDEEIVRELMGHIQKAGFSLWRDKENIEPGRAWQQEIDKGIRDSIAVVAVISPEAVKSAYVLYEWAFALGARVPLIPVLIEVTDNIPSWLKSIHYIDLTQKHEQTVDKLVEKLIEADTLGLQYVRTLEDDLSSNDPLRRKEAIKQLTKENHPIVTEIFAQVVNKHSFPDVSFAAAVQLAKRGDDRAVVRLVDALHDEDSNNRRLATESLVNIGEAAASELLRRLTSESGSARWIVAKTLVSIGEPALTGLVELTQHENPEVRLVSVWALGQTKKQSLHDILHKALEDPDEGVRSVASDALKLL